MPVAETMSKSSGRPGDEEDRGDFIGGLAKGLRVLLAFDGDHPSLTLSEAAQLTGMSAASARRCLLTLQKLGYLTSHNRRFLLRPKVLDLSAAFLSSLNIEALTDRHLSELASETDDSAAMSVLDNTDIVYLARVSIRSMLRMEAHIGSRFPAFATSMGRVLLAALPDDKLELYLRDGEFRAFTNTTVTDRDELRRIILQCRKDDYAAIEDELAYGVVSLAVPVRDSKGRVIAALNSSSHLKKIDKKKLVRERLGLVRQASAQISEDLKRLPSTAISLAQFTSE
jgi:IclR family pca regulon transcriptional regulator